MDKLVLTDTGGFPLKLDDLLWMDGRLDSANKGMYDAIQAHLLAYGTDYIVEGYTYADPNITAGWIMLDSELMRVDAHAGTDDFFVRTVTFDARGSKTFKDTSVNNTYEKIRGVLSGASGSLDINAALRLEDKIIQLLATSAQEFAATNIPNLSANKITSDTLAAARLPAATTSAIGAVEKATTAEAKAFTADKYIDGALLADVNGGFLTTPRIDIGDWDMSTATGTDFVTVTHGIADFKKIQSIDVIIRDDTDTVRNSLSRVDSAGVIDGGVTNIGSTNIQLSRLIGGLFDGIGYDSTSYNRGFITIKYLP